MSHFSITLCSLFPLSVVATSYERCFWALWSCHPLTTVTLCLLRNNIPFFVLLKTRVRAPSTFGSGNQHCTFFSLRFLVAYKRENCTRRWYAVKVRKSKCRESFSNCEITTLWCTFLLMWKTLKNHESNTDEIPKIETRFWNEIDVRE